MMRFGIIVLRGGTRWVPQERPRHRFFAKKVVTGSPAVAAASVSRDAVNLSLLCIVEN
jgi:hypothetical protein